MSEHLWEAKHPYYCNQGNHFDNDCGSEFKSFAEFLAEYEEADMDYNLVFRWDWHEGEDYGAGEFNGDVNYRNGHLLIFWMGQRKGLYLYTKVDVCRADEPAVRAFLEPRFAHLLKLWTPLDPPLPLMAAIGDDQHV